MWAGVGGAKVEVHAVVAINHIHTHRTISVLSHADGYVL
jgi:hypothetical protein